MSEQHAQEFDMALREAKKAWRSTPMLARTKASKAADVVRVANGADGAALARLLAEIAGPSFGSLAIICGLDAEKASQLSESAIHMALLDRPLAPLEGQPGPQDAAARALKVLGHLRLQLRDWIEGSSTQCSPRLHQLDLLLEGRAAARLAILAPIAPALGVCEVVLEAVAAGYPLQACAPLEHWS